MSLQNAILEITFANSSMVETVLQVSEAIFA